MIKLLFLDKQLLLIDEAIAYNLQWDKRYTKFGDFSAMINRQQYSVLSNEIAYVVRSDSKEIGVVNKVADDGDFVTIKGYFYEKKLNNFISYPPYTGKGKVGLVCKEIYDKYIKDPLIRNVYVNFEGQEIRATSYGKEVGSRLLELLNVQNASFKCLYNKSTSDIDLYIYQGANKTRSKGIENAVIFSPQLKNIDNLSFDFDDSNHKTIAIVKAKFNGFDETLEVKGNGYETYGRKELYVDARDISGTDNKEEFLKLLKQRGEEKLAEHKLVTNVLFDAIIGDYKVDIGDVCEVVINNQINELRVIGIYEVFKENQHTTQLEFGDNIISKIQQVQNDKTPIIGDYGNLDNIPTINGDKVIGNLQVLTEEQAKVLLGSKGGYFVVDYNEEGYPRGFRIQDKLILDEKTKMWIFNQGGIGYSEDGGQHLKNIAIDMNGHINANVIGVGQIIGDYFAIDLDNGTITAGKRDENGDFTDVWFSVDRNGAFLKSVEILENNVNQKISTIEANTSSINASVQSLESNVNAQFEGVNQNVDAVNKRVDATMTSDQINFAIKQEISKGVDKVKTSTGFKFDEQGLTISKSGTQMSTNIDEDGMEVSKNNRVVLKADSTGVDATNLRATTYLIVGKHTRFENYKRGTGMFYIK